MNYYEFKKVKPLWFIPTDRWGGTEQVAIADIISLKNLGIQVTLLCKENTPLHAAAMRIGEIEVLTIKQAPKVIDFKFIKELKNILSQTNVNLVYINNLERLPNVALALKSFKNIALVVGVFSTIERNLKNWFFAAFYPRVDKFIVLSEVVRLSLLKNTPISRNKIKVINLGLDFEKFDPQKADGKPLRTVWGGDKDTIIVGLVGRLDESMGQKTFIKAAAGLLKYRERPIRFVIVSEEPLTQSDAYLEELKNLVRTFGIEEYFSFSSLGDNLPEVMMAFDIFVMPGREEVAGLGAIEALAMQRPVVISRVSAAVDIIGNEEFGLFMRPEDAFDLQQKILYLLENPSIRLSMGANGREYVLKHFDARVRLNRLTNIFFKCIKRRN
jgi:glycosyltransferase involved in cell wall biosynthesis